MKITHSVELYVSDVVDRKYSEANGKLRAERETLKKNIDDDMKKIGPKFDKECNAILDEAAKKLFALTKKHNVTVSGTEDKGCANMSMLLAVLCHRDLIPTKYINQQFGIQKRQCAMDTRFDEVKHEILAKLSLGGDAATLEELLSKVSF